MIDEEITFAEKGYYSTDLKPKSAKPVWAICEGIDCQREGGRGRWIRFFQYRALCYICSMKNKPIQKCKTRTEKLPWVDDDITYVEKGYRSTELKSQSSNLVWAVCQGENCEREGGRGRWVMFKACVELCSLCAAKNHHIQKCETPTDKLPWIDDDITFIEKGYRSTELKPQSSNLVWAVCQGENCEREGGRGRWVQFRACRELCCLCACRTAERRKAMSGENHPNWHGGTSFEPYCRKFNNAFKESIREKFDRECFLCGADEEENGRRLDVHHVSYDKECMCNGVECEFVPVCRKCHSMTGGNRELWRRMIMNQLALEGWID